MGDRRAREPPWPSLRSARFPYPLEKCQGESSTPGRCKHEENQGGTTVISHALAPPRPRAVQAPPPSVHHSPRPYWLYTFDDIGWFGIFFCVKRNFFVPETGYHGGHGAALDDDAAD